MANQPQGLKLCPFSWIQTSESPGCFGSLFGQGAQLVWKPQTCMGSACQLWDSAQGNCGLVTKK